MGKNASVKLKQMFLLYHETDVFAATANVQVNLAVLLFERMRRLQLYHLTLFLIVGLLVAAFGCEPVVIYVTPTPDPVVQARETADAQVAALPSETLLPTHTPTETATITTVTETPLPPTATDAPATTAAAPTVTGVVLQVTPAVPQVTPGPTSVVQGPIVGPEYVLPASPIPPTQPGLPTIEGASPTPLPPDVTLVPVLLPNLDGSQIGIQLDVNLDEADWNYAMTRIEQLGIQWIKVQISWRDMQPTGPEERDNVFFRRVEQHLEDANHRGLNVLASVVKAPGWARGTNQTEDGPPDNPEHLANFITIMYDEINAGDRPEDWAIFGLYIDAIEIWNEPNLSREWQGGLPFSGAGYMRLFEPAYRAVRAVSADIPVITAGLAPVGEVPGARDDRAFLREMYAAGLANYADPNVVVGMHPYGWGNAPDATCCDPVDGRDYDNNRVFFFHDTIEDYRRIMVDNGDADRKMWTTEFGWATWDGFPGSPPEPWMGYTDRWAQGGYTIRAFQIGQESGYMGPMFLWNLNFAVLAGMVENRDERAAYSILVPGNDCQFDLESGGRTERPLFWMLFDAVRTDVGPLADFCGVPPVPLPGLPQP